MTTLPSASPDVQYQRDVLSPLPGVSARNPNQKVASKIGVPPAYQKYMAAIALLGHIPTYIQASKVIGNKCSENLSLGAYGIAMVGSVSWLFYGILTSDRIVMTSSSIALIGIVFALFVLIYYATNPGPNCIVV